MTWPNFASFLVQPNAPSLERTVTFASSPTDFVGWVAPTFIDTLGKFNEANAYAADIIEVDGERTEPWLYGPPELGDYGDVANVHLAAYAQRGRSMRARFRVFGDDVAVAGYACALPLDQIGHWIRMKRTILEVDPDTNYVGHEFKFDREVNALVFTGISAFMPLDQFNDENAVAIDVPEVDYGLTNIIAFGGEHLHEEGAITNVFQGVYVGSATQITVRLRTFGSDVAAAGYAIVLYY